MIAYSNRVAPAAEQHIPQGWIDLLCRFPTLPVFTLYVLTLVLLLHLSSIYIAAAAGNPPWFWTTKRIVVVVVAARLCHNSHAQILTRVPRMKTGRQTSPHSFRGTWTLETSVKWELCCQLLYRHCRRRGIYHHRRPPVTIWFHKFIGRFSSLIQKEQSGKYRTQSCWISSAQTTNCR